jgi:hypothetical protein
MTKHTNLFATRALAYDQESDLLSALVFLARHSSDAPDAPLTSYEDTTERASIAVDFSERRYSIADAGDHQGDVELSYPPLVLSAFLAEFDKRYHALPHEASPGDVVPFEFTVEF